MAPGATPDPSRDGQSVATSVLSDELGAPLTGPTATAHLDTGAAGQNGPGTALDNLGASH
jgi:hypothetical protein